MNTPLHATDPEIDTLFELLLDFGHDVFEQRRRIERLATDPESQPVVEKVAQNG